MKLSINNIKIMSFYAITGAFILASNSAAASMACEKVFTVTNYSVSYRDNVAHELLSSLPGDWDLRDIRFLGSKELLANRDYLLWQRFPRAKQKDRLLDPSASNLNDLSKFRYNYLSSESLTRFEQMSDLEIAENMKALNARLAELAPSSTSKYRVPEKPFLARNLNLLYQLFRRKHFVRLFSEAEVLQANGQYTGSDVAKIINNYYATAGNSAKGGYPFEMVLDVMQIFAKKMRDENIEPSEPFLLFGSFPGGRANLQVSDADIHVPKELEPALARIGPKVWSEMTDRMTPENEPKKSSLRKAFESLCPSCVGKPKRKEFTLRSYKPADDYRAADSRLKATNEEVFGFMDPILVRIMNDHIEVLIVDSVSFDRPGRQVSLFLPLNGNSAKYTTPVSDFSREGENELE